jgi:hypothetical protein
VSLHETFQWETVLTNDARALLGEARLRKPHSTAPRVRMVAPEFVMYRNIVLLKKTRACFVAFGGSMTCSSSADSDTVEH